MYYPKCGVEAVEGQKFCKACGTNLELIINIVKGGSRGTGGTGCFARPAREADIVCSASAIWS